jgi:hypothetical protein
MSAEACPKSWTAPFSRESITENNPKKANHERGHRDAENAEIDQRRNNCWTMCLRPPLREKTVLARLRKSHRIFYDELRGSIHGMTECRRPQLDEVLAFGNSETTNRVGQITRGERHSSCARESSALSAVRSVAVLQSDQSAERDKKVPPLSFGVAQSPRAQAAEQSAILLGAPCGARRERAKRDLREVARLSFFDS